MFWRRGNQTELSIYNNKFYINVLSFVFSNLQLTIYYVSNTSEMYNGSQCIVRQVYDLLSIFIKWWNHFTKLKKSFCFH